MQNRKNDQFPVCFWTPVSFPFTIENILLQIQIAKRLFKMIAGENCARQVRLLRFLLMQKFEKKSAKNQYFTALGAPEDFEICD